MSVQNCPASKLWGEKWISFAQAAKLFPPYRQGRPVSPSCVWRWCQKGVKTVDGRVVRLEAMKFINRHFTTVEAVERFIAAQQPPDNEGPAGIATTVPPGTNPKGPRTRSPERRRRDSEKALDHLKKRAKQTG